MRTKKKNSQSKKFLGITIDNDLKFGDDINNISRTKSKCQNWYFVKNSPVFGLAEKKANNECIL